MLKTSVVTVCLNNSSGVEATLKSLSKLSHKPCEILIIDGGSTDDTASVVEKYKSSLPIIFSSEKDKGIYDAMNRGRSLCRGELIHYLNSGDQVFGEPYYGLLGPCKLVYLLSEGEKSLKLPQPTLIWPGYCHQAVIFPREHAEYDCRFPMCADLELIMRLFRSAKKLPFGCVIGGILFDVTGISSTKKCRRDLEQLRIFAQRRAFFLWSIQFIKFIFRALINSLKISEKAFGKKWL